MAGVVCGAAQDLVLGEKPHRERVKIKGQTRYALEAIYMGGGTVAAFKEIASLLAAVLCAVVDGASVGVVTHKHAALANAMGTGVQMWHRDGRAKEVLAKTHPSHKDKRTRPEPHPFSAVIAFQENTVLHVVRGSHNRGEENDFSQDAPHAHHIPIGYAAVFYSILVHRGMGTDGDRPSENVRGHMYLTVAGCTLPSFGKIEASINGPEADATATASTHTPAATTVASAAFSTPVAAATPPSDDTATTAAATAAATAATSATASSAHEYTGAQTRTLFEEESGGMDEETHTVLLGIFDRGHIQHIANGAGTGTGAGSGGTSGAVSDAGTEGGATPPATTATAAAAATTSAPSAVSRQPAVLVPGLAATVTDGTRKDLEARFESFISHLDKGTRKVLMGLLETNSVLDGIESFGEDGKDEGLNNGLFSCLLRKDTAPKEDRSRRPCPFWSNGSRKELSENVAIACTKAQIPLVLEGDAPEKSPMGEMMKYAAGKGVARIGYIGKTSGRGPLTLTPDLTDAWRIGAVSDKQLRDTLNGGTFTIDNTEVRCLEMSAKMLSSSRMININRKPCRRTIRR
ncbi:unnamed protein product [Ectocarpus sp. 4 AP-2014]|uniref:hypothetical protein n=1 Tax=Ectocarpus siliculosus virus 1 TaxID=37665 RepID=UPI0000161E52|nr:hypothetical protein Esvgp007 [Ectocarpus siliculosus virus 1]